MSPTSTPAAAKVSKVEGIKERSHNLREPVATELRQDTTHFSEDAVQILKFHGSYQQDNRDNRVKGQEKDYQFMLRTRSPGGIIPAQLYLALDELSEQYGNHTLRATTRQGFQIHGILKKNLKTVMATIVHNLGSTLGACGDLNRNVMAPPAPFKNRPEYAIAWDYANRIADLLTPQTGAYYEIWLDGEKAVSAEEHPDVVAARQRNGNRTIFHNHEEPIYGTQYMPRKFKACVTVPGDNSVDLFSQDLGLVVITDDQGNLQGFNIYAGGGLGRTHNKEETFARTADPVGYVDKADIYDLVKAIVATQRDYGDRAERRHARMKYLIHDWGVDKFRSMVEGYFGKPLQPLKPLPPFEYKDFLGWHEQGDGKLFLGISVENGRVKDDGAFQLKTALREIEQTFALPMRLTPNHNILLHDIEPGDRAKIQGILTRCGIQSETDIDPLVRYSMACPAMPTCGLAITESERVLPSILERIRALLDRVGLPKEYFVVRMTGCPNGCARPYLAEIGFVGQSPEAYQLWLGADPNQTRLGLVYMDKMPIQDLEKTLEPLFVFFKQKRNADESFGDFTYRVGLEALRQFAAKYQSGQGAKPARPGK
ncbi:MAG: sulfite reductase, ferredoxin dependent [Cyanobacteria bacterium J069]|nr:MAG: sulfite reductase, ferredoxin dependent [Cyanobacteria bacterium J069]